MDSSEVFSSIFSLTLSKCFWYVEVTFVFTICRGCFFSYTSAEMSNKITIKFWMFVCNFLIRKKETDCYKQIEYLQRSLALSPMKWFHQFKNIGNCITILLEEKSLRPSFFLLFQNDKSNLISNLLQHNNFVSDIRQSFEFTFDIEFCIISASVSFSSFSLRIKNWIIEHIELFDVLFYNKKKTMTPLWI